MVKTHNGPQQNSCLNHFDHRTSHNTNPYELLSGYHGPKISYGVLMLPDTDTDIDTDKNWVV